MANQRKRLRGAQTSRFGLIVAGLIVGGAAGYMLTLDDPETTLYLAQHALTNPFKSFGSAKSWAFYPNCAAARRAGVAPLHRGDAGYAERLDADQDGVACEPFVGR